METVSSGGITSNSLVANGGAEYVNSGGLAISTTLGSTGPAADQGFLYVASGGTTVGTTVFSGSDEYLNGGVASASVLSGGTEYVAGDFEVYNGSGYVWSGGGTAIDTVIATSGTLDLEDGNNAAGSITFTGSGGTLEIGMPGFQDPTMPTVPISGFAATDKIDLTTAAYTSTGSATFSDGVLTVTEGGQS